MKCQTSRVFWFEQDNIDRGAQTPMNSLPVVLTQQYDQTAHYDLQEAACIRLSLKVLRI